MGVYHHKVQQAAAGLRVAIEHLLTAAGEHRTAADRFLTDIEAIAGDAADAAALARFADYDDAWWFELMRDALNRGVPAEIEPWLALFCRRRPGPKSLWKRPNEFPADRRRWNARLPGRDEVELRQRWDEISADLQSRGVLVVRLGFTPWTPSEADPSASVFGVWNPKTDERFPLTELSPLTAALAEAWASDLHVLAFVAEEGRIAPEQVLAELEPALLPEQE